MLDRRNFSFPLFIGEGGGIGSLEGDDALRAKIIQLLFTGRGERVHQPEFGSGLQKLVFEGNDDILAAATEFTIGQDLTQWLGDLITVDWVHAQSVEETMTVEIVYRRRVDEARQALRIEFK